MGGDMVEVTVKVGLPRELVRKLKDDPSCGLEGMTDEEVVLGLHEDITNRYFNTEYFDASRIAP